MPRMAPRSVTGVGPDAAAAARGRQVLRIGVTGLARAGKTAFLSSAAANLLAPRTGLPVLSRRLAGRLVRVAIAPAGAESMPRFDFRRHLATLAADPPRWPARTEAVSLLALDLDIARPGLARALPPRRLRLEFLDYPGEWLLDLPLLGQDFRQWSEAALARLQTLAPLPARAFLDFLRALPARAGADEPLAETGHGLYRALLNRLREEGGLAMLQPGRFLMPAPGPEPPWMAFFPLQGGGGGLFRLLAARYDAYRRAVARDLVSPGFGRLDRLVVLADVLSALHAGPAAFADMADALGSIAEALRWRRSRTLRLPQLGTLRLPAWLGPGGIGRVAFAATKADHVAERQRASLAALMRAMTLLPDAAGEARAAVFAIAAVRCAEDFVWTLDGGNVAAVRGRVLGDERLTRSYPGEVPDRLPGAAFWAQPFLALPQFEPMRLPDGGAAGVPQIGLDALIGFLLDDVL